MIADAGHPPLALSPVPGGALPMLPTLRQGATGDAVIVLQAMLARALTASLSPDGTFGPVTARTLAAWQNDAGLPLDGVCGPAVWASFVQRGVAPAWLLVAIGELTQHEITGAAANPRIVQYFTACTYHATSDEVAWCSAFVCWVLAQCGRATTQSATAASWLPYGQRLDQSRLGAIAVLTHEVTPDPATGSHSGYHVAFELCTTATHILLLGGNQHDAVRVSAFPLDTYRARRRWPIGA